MYGVEIWGGGVEEGWNEIVQNSCENVQKFLGISRFPANWVAELELGKDSGRGKVMSTLVKI
jgi:hypothetical protein